MAMNDPVLRAGGWTEQARRMPIPGLVVAAVVVPLSIALTACSSASDNEGGEPVDFEERFDQLVSAVASGDYSALYEVTVPPSKRQNCTKEFLVDWHEKWAEASPLLVSARTSLFENAEFLRTVPMTNDQTTVIVENNLTGAESQIDFRREKGQWFFRDPALSFEEHSLFGCNPD